MAHSQKQQGFTLVELSIVLVILGLLVGGVLTGQSLIRAAEIRAVTTEHQRYVTAIATFRDKYFAVPGDMPNAVAYWGAQDLTQATCETTESTTALTCNGNGDGMVAPLLDASQRFEAFRAWQHLANAGLIEGNYTGRAGASNLFHSVAGQNVPRSKLNGGGWLTFYLNNGNGTTIFMPAVHGYVMTFGKAPNQLSITDAVNGPILKAEEAYNIDSKIDDALPHTGRLMSLYMNGSRPECVLPSNIAYNLTSTAVGCHLEFKLGV